MIQNHLLSLPRRPKGNTLKSTILHKQNCSMKHDTSQHAQTCKATPFLTGNNRTNFTAEVNNLSNSQGWGRRLWGSRGQVKRQLAKKVEKTLLF